MMATNHTNKKTVLLRELLTCSLCLEEMTKSRLLPCHHGYCLNCLQKYFDSSAKDNKLSCPVCRVESTVPEGGVQHFSPNIFIHSLREALDGDSEDEERDKKEVATDSIYKCDSDDCKDLAVYFCTAGCGYMCLTCVGYHGKMRLSRNHIIIEAREGGSKSKQLPFCTRHPNHIVELYCDDCSVPCCATCVVLYHQTHKCCELASKESTFRTKVEHVLVDIDKCLEKTKNAMTSTDEWEKQMEADVDELVKMTADTFTNLRQQLTTKEESIHQQIMLCKPYAQKQIADVRDRQEMIRALIDSSKRYGNEMLDKATPYDFATNTDGFAEHVQKKLLPGPAQFVWSCVHSTTDKALFATGNVHLAEAKTLIPGDDQLVLKSRDVVLRVSGVSRIDVAMDGDIIFCVRESDKTTLHAYSPDGKKLNNITTQCRIDDLAVYTIDEKTYGVVLVGTFDDYDSNITNKYLSKNCICYLEMNRHKLTMSNVGRHIKEWEIKTVSLNEDNVALLGCNTSRVYKIEKPSKYLGAMLLPLNVKGLSLISDPASDGHIFIDSSLKKIVWLDSKCHKIKESKETNITRFVADGNGMLIAISSNYHNSLLVIDDTGATKAHIVPHNRKLERPRALCFDKENHLLYVSHIGEVVILEYPACLKDSFTGHSCVLSLKSKLPAV